MTYTMTIAGLKRELPICKVNDDLYIGAFICFGDAEVTEAAAAAMLKKLEGIANGTGGGIVLFCQSPQRGKPPVGKFSRGDTGAQSVIQLFFQSFVGHNLPPVF